MNLGCFLNIVKGILDNDLKMFRNNCPLDITDRVFYIIQNKFLKEYRSTIGSNNKHKNKTNRAVGRFIREYWRLKNLRERKSIHKKLIITYTQHTN